MQLGELAHHFGNEVGFGQAGGAFGLGAVCPQRGGGVGGDALQPLDAFGLRADFVVVHHVCQLGQAAFQRVFLVLFVEKFGVRQARAQNAFVAVDDVRRVSGFKVGYQQKAVHQAAVCVQKREAFLVLLHGENQAFLRHFQKMRFKTGFEYHRPFHQRGHFVQ